MEILCAKKPPRLFYGLRKNINALIQWRDLHMDAASLQQALSDPKRIISFAKNFVFIDKRKLYQHWETTSLQRLFEFLDVDCVFDVGANKGQYAQMLRRKIGYKGLIFSFEPSPHDASIAREHSQGDGNWHIIELAIAETDGEAQFNLMRASEFSSFSTPRHDEVQMFREMNSVAEIVTVHTETLQTVLHQLKKKYVFERPFLKMDTQGFDVKIVKASPDAVRSFVGLQSELAIAKLYSDSVDFREAISEYERLGFLLSAFVPNNAGHFPRLVETDCLMIRADLVR